MSTPHNARNLRDVPTDELAAELERLAPLPGLEQTRRMIVDELQRRDDDARAELEGDEQRDYAEERYNAELLRNPDELEPWLVTETPHDPPAGLYWHGPARDALHALDLFAEAEGFATYSSQLETEEGAELVGDEEAPLGARWAIFTNTTVYAIPGELEQGSHVTRTPIPGEQPSPATAAFAAAADVLLPLTRGEAELLAAIVDFGGVDNDNLSSIERSTAEAIADTLRAALNRG